MRTVLLDFYIDEARKIFGDPRKTVLQEKLRTRFEAKHYAGVIGAIQTSLEVDISLRIGWRKEIVKQSFTSITLEIPKNVTLGRASLPCTIFMSRDVAEFMSFEMMVTGFAHLLTRLLLLQKQSFLVDDPTGIDVVAMLLGFHEFYVKESAYTYTQPSTTEDFTLNLGAKEVTGSITLEEARYVAQKLRG